VTLTRLTGPPAGPGSAAGSVRAQSGACFVIGTVVAPCFGS